LTVPSEIIERIAGATIGIFLGFGEDGLLVIG
jgi:hypothetical protein